MSVHDEDVLRQELAAYKIHYLIKPIILEEFLKAFSGMPDEDPLMAARLNLILPVIRIELALTTLFPNIQWEKGQLGFDPDQNGKVHLIQNLSQARRQNAGDATSQRLRRAVTP